MSLVVALVTWTSLATAGETETGASLSVGYLQHQDLWVGDPLLGDFDGDSSLTLANRFLVRPSVELTHRVGTAHRFRLRANGRSLQRVTFLDEELAVRSTLASDGVPVSLAVRERAFLDEATWRVRSEERAVDLRLGMQPFAIANGRFLVESWPGARLVWRPGRAGGPPLAVDARTAVRIDGSVQGALALRREFSHFEHIGLDLAVVRDRQGIAPMVEQDISLLTGTFSASSATYLQANRAEVEAFIEDRYLDSPYGIDAFAADIADLMDLSSEATLAYLSAGGAGWIGRTELDVEVIGMVGRGAIRGQRLNGAVPSESWLPVGTSDWSQPFALRALAWDVALEWHAPIGLFGFAQGATGEPDLVQATVDGSPASAFVAADQSFLRSRVFPIDVAQQGGAWTHPPGVGSHGLAAFGGGMSARWRRSGARLQGTVSSALIRRCLGCDDPSEEGGLRYGEELDLLLWTGHGAVRPLLDVGGFFGGPFFLDPSSPDRDERSDLAIGWRVFAGLSTAVGSLR